MISAFPTLNPYALELSVGIVVVLTVVNLRGIKESGKSFAAPIYLFIATVASVESRFPGSTSAFRERHSAMLYCCVVPRFRFLVAALVGATLTGAIGASPASAASLSITCPGTFMTVVRDVTINVSEEIVMNATSCTQFVIPTAAAGSAIYQGITYGPGSTVSYTGGDVTYIPPKARMLESKEITFVNTGVSPNGYYDVFVMVTASDTPAEFWFQSIGRLAGAICDAGWNSSWEQWPNGGTGGFTCNRQVLGIDGFTYPTVRGNPGRG